MTTPTKMKAPILSVCTAPASKHEVMTPGEAQDVAGAQATSSFEDALDALRQAEAEGDDREHLAAVLTDPNGTAPLVLMRVDSWMELTEAAFGGKA